MIRRAIDQLTAWTIDSAMCLSMFAIQRRHKLHASSREELERYIAECEPLTREQFFAAPTPGISIDDSQQHLRWQSPITTAFPANDHVHVDLFPCPAGWSAPTVLFLHALMSTSDAGYHRWAARFNARGWNACFIHLPFHYSRTPPGHVNGELSITPDLVRTGEGLRQGVAELRQLMALLRARGCSEFALWATSYGGWISALLASVERDFRFVALMEPIVDVEHAIWRSGAGLSLRRELRARGIPHSLIARHSHLTSPLHGKPLCDPGRIFFAAGEYDRIAPLERIAHLCQRWHGADLITIPQGHFGYRMMWTMWNRLVALGVI